MYLLRVESRQQTLNKYEQNECFFIYLSHRLSKNVLGKPNKTNKCAAKLNLKCELHALYGIWIAFANNFKTENK